MLQGSILVFFSETSDSFLDGLLAILDVWWLRENSCNFSCRKPLPTFNPKRGLLTKSSVFFGCIVWSSGFSLQAIFSTRQDDCNPYGLYWKWDNCLADEDKVSLYTLLWDEGGTFSWLLDCPLAFRKLDVRRRAAPKPVKMIVFLYS